MLTMGFCVCVRRVEKRDFNTTKPLQNQMKCCALLSSLKFKLRKLNTKTDDDDDDMECEIVKNCHNEKIH